MVRVGIVTSVEDGTISVETLDGPITVRLANHSTVQEFADHPPEDLSVGQRVTVMGRGTEDGVAARAVIVTLENTSLFQDQGDFQIGRGSRALVGIIERIDDGSISIGTKLGPRTATINAGETAIRMPAPATTTQLSEGMLVTVVGSEDTNGGITAQSVLITPELGGLMSAGRTGGRRGQAGGSRPSSGAAAVTGPPLTFDTERQSGTYAGIKLAITEPSEAIFRVREQMALIPLPHRAEMRTQALTGEIRLDGGPSVIKIDLHQLSGDQNFRDRYVRRTMFPDHPEATFTIEDIGALPDGFAEGEEIKAEVAGILNIRGSDYPLNFDVVARDGGDAINISGKTKFTWDSVGMSAPTAGVVLRLSEDVEVRFAFTAKPVR